MDTFSTPSPKKPAARPMYQYRNLPPRHQAPGFYPPHQPSLKHQFQRQQRQHRVYPHDSPHTPTRNYELAAASPYRHAHAHYQTQHIVPMGAAPPPSDPYALSLARQMHACKIIEHRVQEALLEKERKHMADKLLKKKLHPKETNAGRAAYKRTEVAKLIKLQHEHKTSDRHDSHDEKDDDEDADADDDDDDDMKNGVDDDDEKEVIRTPSPQHHRKPRQQQAVVNTYPPTVQSIAAAQHCMAMKHAMPYSYRTNMGPRRMHPHFLQPQINTPTVAAAADAQHAAQTAQPPPYPSPLRSPQVSLPSLSSASLERALSLPSLSSATAEPQPPRCYAQHSSAVPISATTPHSYSNTCTSTSTHTSIPAYISTPSPVRTRTRTQTRLVRIPLLPSPFTQDTPNSKNSASNNHNALRRTRSYGKEKEKEKEKLKYSSSGGNTSSSNNNPSDNNNNNGEPNIAPAHSNVQSVISPNGGIYHPCHGYSTRKISIFDVFPNIVKYQSKKYTECDRVDYLLALSDKPFPAVHNRPLKVQEADMWYTALKYLFNDITLGQFDYISVEMRYVLRQYMANHENRATFLNSIKQFGFLRVISDIQKKLPKEHIQKLIRAEHEKREKRKLAVAANEKLRLEQQQRLFLQHAHHPHHVLVHAHGPAGAVHLATVPPPHPHHHPHAAVFCSPYGYVADAGVAPQLMPSQLMPSQLMPSPLYARAPGHAHAHAHAHAAAAAAAAASQTMVTPVPYPHTHPAVLPVQSSGSSNDTSELRALQNLKSHDLFHGVGDDDDDDDEKQPPVHIVDDDLDWMNEIVNENGAWPQIPELPPEHKHLTPQNDDVGLLRFVDLPPVANVQQQLQLQQKRDHEDEDETKEEQETDTKFELDVYAMVFEYMTPNDGDDDEDGNHGDSNTKHDGNADEDEGNADEDGDDEDEDAIAENDENSNSKQLEALTRTDEDTGDSPATQIENEEADESLPSPQQQQQELKHDGDCEEVGPTVSFHELRGYDSNEKHDDSFIPKSATPHE